MHSSRMRTGRSFTVSVTGGGGVSGPGGGGLVRGVSGPGGGGVVRGCLVPGGDPIMH